MAADHREMRMPQPQPRRVAELHRDGGSGGSGPSEHDGLSTLGRTPSALGASGAAGAALAAPSPNTAAKEGEPARMAGEGGTGVDMIHNYRHDPYCELRQRAEATRAIAVERRRSNAGLPVDALSPSASASDRPAASYNLPAAPK